MTPIRRIAATLAIVAVGTLGVAGIANASDYDGHRGHDHDGDRHDHSYYHHRGLVGEVLHLVVDIL
jgi:hypothetical protein